MLKPFRKKRLGDILLERGDLTQDQLAYALDKQHSTKERLGIICLADGLISDIVLAMALAEQFGLEYVDLKGVRPDESLFNFIPPEVTFRFHFVPLDLQGDLLVVAISDPTAVLQLDEMALLLERPLLFKVAAESEIAYHLKRGEGTSRVLKEVSEDFMLQLVTETDKGEEILSVENVTADTSPIIKLVNSTILDALTRRASDIHIETAQDGVLIKYRIDGVLYKATDPIDSHFQGPLISRLKVMSELDISERRIPQDGRFKVRIGSKSIDFRVSIMPSAFGEDAVIRILDKESIASDLRGLTLETLGMAPREIKRFRKMIKEPYGMVLVTGPTGSGKTTTLYGALTEIHTGLEKIITIEDPVEYVLSGITQIPVNEKKGLTFARGLRSVLRHDPDKIMVGEIRDSETAQIAVQSALTGHLVFTTVHANNVFDVIGRFTHMGIDPYNFVACLNCVMAQRLVRKICPACRKPVTVTDDELRESAIDPESTRGLTLYEARGCDECNGTGYRGRSAIVELLDLNDEIRELIIAKSPVAALKKAAKAAGTMFLRESAVAKVLAGETTIKEINRVTFVE
ncbi:type II secretion system ATPase PulE [Citrifermentans bemidjiense Bem]|uniref:Type II secretion system ATPase PulE n=1 Tax=Citrifermentans bemidjiense (strain ATCC BAA-1014 / DSM 16622 / JCM 12645 / Bem) TaxID=404380 RepID=B5EI34_CITBB|nr:GspE/PulE family protein [Citrifermentans bemidjiense]ACH38298.1 type II secretion system ATPase PulE [Citrifermentans bemidjiense Bem]